MESEEQTPVFYWIFWLLLENDQEMCAKKYFQKYEKKGKKLDFAHQCACIRA